MDQEKLYDAMANKGMFIRDICRRLNITENKMNKVLSGDADLDTVYRIAHILNVNVDELATNKGGTDE